MDFALDDEQALVAQSVRRFAERELRAWAADADRAAAAPERLYAAGAELGLFLDAVPAADGGGLDGPYSHVMRALRGFELARGCAALAALLEANVEPALAVAAWGGPAARAQLFGALTAGQLATWAFDGARQLRVSPDVGGLRLAGALGPVPALAAASQVVIATAEAVVLVDARQLARAEIAPSGWRAARWATAVVDDVRVPDEQILARGAAAAAAGAVMLGWSRVSLAARAAGVATAAMEHAERYARERVQFGQPIGQFEAVIRLRDDAVTQARAARLMALYAGWAIDVGAADAADAASRARVIGGDAVARATVDAVQIFGGYGFVNDYPVEKLMRDSRAFEALHGDERLARVLAERAGAPL